MSLLRNKKLWAATGIVGCLGMMFVMLLIVIGGVALWAVSSNEGLAASGDVVSLRGQIVDQQTQQPLERALFLVLKPGVTYQQFLDVTDPNRRSGLIQGGSYTDATGVYDVADIPRGNRYTVIAVADGYAPLSADHVLEITSSDPSVTELNLIGLQRERTSRRENAGGSDVRYAASTPAAGSRLGAEVTLRGQILDASRGRGVEGHTLVLQPGITGAQSNDGVIRGS